MKVAYPTTYRDSRGEIATTIENDGRTLRMSLGGVFFVGTDFDSLELVSGAEPVDVSRFTLAAGALCGCSLEFEIPARVNLGSTTVRGTLRATLALGLPRADSGIESEALTLVLVVENLRLASRGRSGWFEDELADLQRQLPEGGFLQMCFGCGLSDYSPGGHGLFGSLACFRDNADAYRSVKTKADLFRLWETMTAPVQETFCCPRFERRKAGAGYRG